MSQDSTSAISFTILLTQSPIRLLELPPAVLSLHNSQDPAMFESYLLYYF